MHNGALNDCYYLLQRLVLIQLCRNNNSNNTLHMISTFSTLPLVLTIQSNFVIIFFLASSSKIPAAIPRVTTPTTVSDAISFNSVPISNPLLLAIAALPPSAPLPPDSHTSCSVPPLTSTASIGS